MAWRSELDAAVLGEYLDEWAHAALAVEFADTLSRTWVERRAELLPLLPDAAYLIAVMLEALSNVTIGAEPLMAFGPAPGSPD